MSKCPKCGAKGSPRQSQPYGWVDAVFECGSTIGCDELTESPTCVRRQLAAKSAECEKLKEVNTYTYEEYLRAFKPTDEETPPSDPAEFGKWLADKTIAIFRAALSRAEGKE